MPTFAAQQDPILTASNLATIKAFMLARGQTRTYSNKYSRNPWMETATFDLYLNPDPGGPHNHPQWNIDCDPRKGDFHLLVIHRKSTAVMNNDDFSDPYRILRFDSRIEMEAVSPQEVDLDPWEMPRRAMREALEIIATSRRSW